MTDTSADPLVFSAELRPYRSLGRHGLKVLIVITCAIALVNALFFLVSGAWPVAFFFGLDLLLLYGAFWLSYRSGRAREEIAISRSAVTVRKISPVGRVRIWSDNPFWSRFDVDRHDDFGITGMAVTGRRSGRTEVGSFLNPDDRESFARAFSAALTRVKRGI